MGGRLQSGALGWRRVEDRLMAVFRYEGTIRGREEYTESGTAVAKSEEEALQKLRRSGLENISLERLRGLSALVKRFLADVK